MSFPFKEGFSYKVSFSQSPNFPLALMVIIWIYRNVPLGLQVFKGDYSIFFFPMWK